jgi:hypothetical protein
LVLGGELKELLELGRASDFYWLKKLPIGRAFEAVKVRLASALGNDPFKRDTLRQEDASYEESVIIGVIERYTKNMKMIRAVSKAFGVRRAFVWQPVPVYKYDLDYHLFAKWGFEGVYERQARVRKNGAVG